MRACIPYIIRTFSRKLSRRDHAYKMSDEAIQTTNDDATQSKKYAVDKGYWTDNYISYFCPLVDRKTPEICRGYYARVKSIHSLLTKFLKLTSCDCQVINLGAGYDSLYWVLNEKGLRPKLFIDVDFTEVTSRKCYLIKTKHQLLDVVKETDGSFELRGDELWSKHYHVMSCDMRKIDQFSSKLIAHCVDIKLPTIFIAECVLIYMDSTSSRDILRWIGGTFSTAMFLNYEPIRPNDRFGQTMVSNLKYRGCPFSGISDCPELEHQEERFIQCGWNQSWALDMEQVYSLLPRGDVERIERIDFLDEKELLIQLLKHYTLSCGYNDLTGIGLSSIQLN